MSRPAGTLIRVLRAGWVMMLLGAAGCGSHDAQVLEAGPPPDVPAVTVNPVTIPRVYEFIGQTDASKTVEA